MTATIIRDRLKALLTKEKAEQVVKLSNEPEDSPIAIFRLNRIIDEIYLMVQDDEAKRAERENRPKLVPCYSTFSNILIAHSNRVVEGNVI